VRALGILIGALGVLWFLAHLSFALPGERAGWGLDVGPNLSGPAGHRLATFGITLLGSLTALTLPLLVLVGAARLLVGRRLLLGRVAVALLGWTLLLPPLLWLADPHPGEASGGAFGALVGGTLREVFGPVGAWVLVLAGVLSGVVLLVDLAVPGWITDLSERLRPASRSRGSRPFAAVSRSLLASGAWLFATPTRVRAGVARFRSERAARVAVRRARASDTRASRTASDQVVRGTPSAGPVARTSPSDGAGFIAPPEPFHHLDAVSPPPDREPGIVEPAPPTAGPGPSPVKKVRRADGHRKRPAHEFDLPPLDILTVPPTEVVRPDRAALLDLSETLRRTLEEFGIRGRVGEVHPGPVITRYDFEPAPGIKVNQVVSREDDIALALRTDRVRILTRVPGKAAVGIEIPNESRELIHFYDVASQPGFEEGILTLALGKDASGHPFCDRLETMPHLLVAGTTGSGKSVCINTIIASLLFRHHPEDLRLILIDPKMLELTGYEGIPHLALPVVTESKEASKALNWLVREMERRYRLLAGKGVRNIQTYHERFFVDGEPVAPPDPEESLPEPMPYIVCVVDELADLMMTHASEVETPIARLAQMARAVGIHLILATQRPSVDVLTGVIKANFPARIAFQVASRTDSRTILDQNGAESLVGKGDMLYLPSGRSVPLRVHGAFLSDQDIEALVAYLRGFHFEVDQIDLDEKSLAPGGVEGEEDPLYAEAARAVVLQGQASTSFLQRRLKIGYARAGRLMDQLEQGGIVSGFEGSKARDVLVDLDYLEEQGIV
jgi:S-DNA-T family DNA segregation ATPase FtsK/SpoIIIE